MGSLSTLTQPQLAFRLSRFLLRLKERLLAGQSANKNSPFDNRMVIGNPGHYAALRHRPGQDGDERKRVIISWNFFESLILAQDERWRCALGMQVERIPSQDGVSGGRVRMSKERTLYCGIARRKTG